MKSRLTTTNLIDIFVGIEMYTSTSADGFDEEDMVI